MTLCTTRHNSIYKNILTKCLSHNYNRLTSISQLFADHSSISVVPGVVTHCPPLVIDVQLHSTLILIRTSHQTNISIGIVATCINYMTIIKVTSKQWLKQNHRLFYNYLHILPQHLHVYTYTSMKRCGNS